MDMDYKKFILIYYKPSKDKETTWKDLLDSF